MRDNEVVAVIFIGFICCHILFDGSNKADQQNVSDTNPQSEKKTDFEPVSVEKNKIKSDLIENVDATVNKDDIKKSCYWTVMDRKLNWFEAAHDCRRMGAHLAYIQSDAEIHELFTVLAEAKNIQGTSFWISGNDLGAEGEYYWLATGKPMLSFKWDENEPNDYAGQEDCVSIHQKNEEYRMNDLNCMQKNHFICMANTCIPILQSLGFMLND